MSSQIGFAESKVVARTRMPEMPEGVARLLSLVVVLILCSGIAYFRQDASEFNLGRTVTNPLHPRYLYVVYALFMVGSMAFPNRALKQKVLPTRVFWACALFAIYMVFQMLVEQNADPFWVGYRFEFMIMLPAFIVTFASVSEPGFIFRTLRWVVVAECLLNIFLLASPRSFPLLREFGRVSGFWGNPNVAAQMIAGSVPLITMRLRLVPRSLLYLVTLAGVLATLSREGIVLWAEMFSLSAFLRLDRSDTTTTSADRAAYGFGLALAPLLSLTLFNRQTMDTLANVTSSNTARLSSTRDFSIWERGYVLKLAFEKFLEKPIMGNGLGYTMNWGYAVSTHNMFLLILAEHGVIGFLLLLNWIASFWTYLGNTRLWMIGFFVTVGMFSHNLFEAEYAPLFALYWLAGFMPRAPEIASGPAVTSPSNRPSAA